VLRRCQALDVEGIYEVERKCFRPDDVYSAELLRFLCSYCGDHSYVYVADGKIIGYIITCIEGNAAHVISIATDPQYRRRGVGKSLLCTALSLLAKGEVQEVFLEVRVTNEAALSLYRAAGFEVVEVLKNYYSDGEDGYRLSLRDRKRAEEFCHNK
jgi:ribosomal-protein-alanine N-acetyltransferase